MLGARSSPTRLSQVPCEKVVRGGAVWEGQGSRVVCQKTAPFSLQLWSTTFLDGKARLYVIYLIEVSWFWLHCSENKDVGVKEMKAKFHCISLIFHFISTWCFSKQTAFASFKWATSLLLILIFSYYILLYRFDVYYSCFSPAGMNFLKIKYVKERSNILRCYYIFTIYLYSLHKCYKYIYIKFIIMKRW